MTGYFGTERQKRLQVQVEADAGLIASMPGACQMGRMMGCDDLDRFGWDRIEALLARDGVFGFRLIPADRLAEMRSWLSDRGFRLDTWDVFLADRDTALAASVPVVERGLPDGLRELATPTRPDDPAVERIQTSMSEAGISPFSGSMLVGALGPASTVIIVDADGTVVATAHSYLPHNDMSPYHRYAWGGLVSVASSQRGKGLGAYVNARMVVRAFSELRATHIYELVSPTNEASRRMVASCGLTHESRFVAAIAAAQGESRFTR